MATITIDETSERIRYYCHGDRYLDDPSLYYCAACGVFQRADHFQRHNALDHRQQYRYSLEAAERITARRPKYFRPSWPENLFA